MASTVGPDTGESVSVPLAVIELEAVIEAVIELEVAQQAKVEHINDY